MQPAEQRAAEPASDASPAAAHGGSQSVVLEISDLRIEARAGETWTEIVKGVSLELRAGEWHALDGADALAAAMGGLFPDANGGGLHGSSGFMTFRPGSPSVPCAVR